MRTNTYTVGSEQVTFAATAPLGLAGTTATRWFVKDQTGRKVTSGLSSEAAADAAADERRAAERPVTVRLAGGGRRRVPAGSADRFLGLDEYGLLVYRSADVPGLVYAVTPCCQATGTGGAGGVECRACHRPVDSYFGGPAEVAVPRVADCPD